MAGFKEKIKNFPWGYLMFAITFIVIGLCFIIFTAQSIDVMCYGIGIVTILSAVVNVVLVLAKKQRGGGFYIKMLLCVFAILCGVIIIISKESTLEYVIAISAVMLIIDAAFKMQTIISMQKYKVGMWWAILVCVLVAILGNFILIKFYTVEQAKLFLALLGVMLILDGAFNLMTPICLSAVNKRRLQEENASLKGSKEAEKAIEEKEEAKEEVKEETKE